MSVVSYRIECTDCGTEEVIRERDFDDTLWTIGSAHNHSGRCPECNPAIAVEDMEEARESQEDDDKEVSFTEIDGVGQSVADEFRRIGIETRGDVRMASDEKLKDVSGVGQGKAESIREYVG